MRINLKILFLTCVGLVLWLEHSNSIDFRLAELKEYIQKKNATELSNIPERT